MVAKQKDMRIPTELVPKCPVCGVPMTINSYKMMAGMLLRTDTMTAKNPKAAYACINYGEAVCPSEIERQSVCIDEDIATVLTNVK